MYVLGPLIAAALLGALILVSRWAFGKSLVDGGPQHGLLVPVAEGIIADDLSALQDALLEAGVRNTVADGPGGYRLLVWPADLTRARDLLRQARRLN
jgi:hypothetical protein